MFQSIIEDLSFLFEYYSMLPTIDQDHRLDWGSHHERICIRG